MRILVVEGNTEEGMGKTIADGWRPNHERYANVLQGLSEGVQCEFAFPSERGREALPEGFALGDFSGTVWTGSPLHVYKETAAVKGQLTFAERLYASGVPVFGSCWGLQVMTRALGGRVRKNPKGREIGIATDLEFGDAGRAHPMFGGKGTPFACFTVHLDEVEEPAPGTTVLAHNSMSAVQAVSIETGGRFWGVQYHPEFSYDDLTRIIDDLKKQLIQEGTCGDAAAVAALRAQVANGPRAFDRIELRNWLATLGG